MKLIEGLDLALKIKEKETRKSTILRYSSFVTRFIDYLKLQEMEQMQLEEFSKKDAIKYLDYVLCEKGVSPLTRNNYLQAMKTLFYSLNYWSCFGVHGNNSYLARLRIFTSLHFLRLLNGRVSVI